MVATGSRPSGEQAAVSRSDRGREPVVPDRAPVHRDSNVVPRRTRYRGIREGAGDLDRGRRGPVSSDLPPLSISTLAAISVERLAVSRSYTPSSASVIPDPGVDSVRDPS